MLSAIIGGIVGLGGAILNLFGTNNVAEANLEAAKYAYDTQLEMSKIDADSRKMATNKAQITNITGDMYDFEKNKYTSSALQSGVLIVGIIIVAIIFITKKK